MRVSTCCCFFSLKTGCIVISIYYVVLSLYLLVSSTIDLSDILQINGRSDEPMGKDNQGMVKATDPIIRGMLWTFLTIIALHAIVSFLLFLGAMKEIPAILFFWVIFNIIFLLAVISGMVVRLFLDPRRFIGAIGKRIFSILVGIYFLVVVKSFHSKLKERQESSSNEDSL